MLTILLVLLVLALLLAAVGYWLFYIGVCRFVKDPDVQVPKSMSAYADIIRSGREWYLAQEKQLVEISSSDGTRLVGEFLPAEGAKGTVLLVHGFRSSPVCDFSCAFRFYHELGYNILAVYQRAHGLSGSSYITYGVKERFDVQAWAYYLYDRFGGEHDVFLGGISMGASSVLMASGLALPPNVRGIVADCGFTSPYDEFREIFKRRRIPVHPLFDIAQLYARLFAGFDFRGASTLDALKVNRIPVLFFHGGKDLFVPTHFSHDNHNICAAEKEIIIVPDAWHGASYLLETEKYEAAVESFFARHASI